MPLCVVCGDKLTCTSSHVGKKPSCRVDDGAIWIHVMDDTGEAVEKVGLTVGETPKKTDKTGFTSIDPLKPGPYPVRLDDLTDDLATTYDLPGVREKPVQIGAGGIAYLPFTLFRKAELKVRVQKGNDEHTVFPGATVTIKPKNGAEAHEDSKDGGIADFGLKSADEYTITAVLSGADQKSYYVPEKPLVEPVGAGEKKTIPFPVNPLARPQVKVVWGTAKPVEGVTVTVKSVAKGTPHDFGKTAVTTATTERPLSEPGLMPADEYEIEVDFEKKDYIKKTPPDRFTPGDGDTTVHTVQLVKLAKPQFEVVCGSDKIKDVEIKLKNTTHDFGKSADVTGLAKLASDAPGVEPGVEHEVELKFDDKVYVADKTYKFTFAEGYDGTEQIKLLKLARPRVKVIDQATKKELEGITVKLTPGSGPDVTMDPTGKSGITEIPKAKPGLAPAKYTVAVEAPRYVPVLVSPLDVTFAEGSTETVVVTVTTPKGALLVRINRYDGKMLPARVTFTLNKSPSGTLATTATTASRQVEVEKEDQRTVTGEEDFKLLDALDPDTYVVKIPNLDVDVLAKQGASIKPWKIGPTETGEVKVKVEPAQTAEVELTLTKYVKAQLIGYSCLPGFEDGRRCPTCFKQFPATAANCTVDGAALKAKRCPDCGDCYDAGAATCTKCFIQPIYWCCGDRRWGSTCNACGTAAPHGCAHCSITWPPPSCPNIGCTDTLSFACQYCGAFRPNGATCTVCSNAIELNCPTHGWVVGATTCGGCGSTQHTALAGERIYLGLPSNREDLFARCLAMKAAIQKAQPLADANEDVIKVFMAPEFYFRGIDGAYRIDDVSLIMDQMRKETKDAKYKDWLFVFGTAIGYYGQSPATKPAEQHLLKVVATATMVTKIKVTHGVNRVAICNKVPAENATLSIGEQWKVDTGVPPGVPITAVTKVSDDEYELDLAAAVTFVKDAPCELIEPSTTEIFNVALVQKGGPDDGITGLRESITYKEKISHIDFLRNKHVYKDWSLPTDRQVFVRETEGVVLPTEGADEVLTRNKNPVSGERTKVGYGGGSVFTVDGVTFGMEVCLDHAKKKLYKYYSANPTGAPRVQIQLIPSWGMSIEDESLVGMVNTLVFNVDGPLGSDAGTVTAVAPGGSFTRFAVTATHAVPAGAPEDIHYSDTSSGKAVAGSIIALDPVPAKLLQENDHQTNRTGAGAGKGRGWVDIYPVKSIPPGEIV